MTNRTFRQFGAGGLVFAGLVATLTAQASAPWVDQWTAAQTHRPAQVLNHARIASVAEPGLPLVIHGLVLAPDGKTPVKDAIVFAYHTDQGGLYRAPGTPEAPWRLQGWARTDSHGRFEFETIRPAPYPNRQVPAHIHTTIESAQFGRQISGVQFADDPLVSKEDRGKSVADGPSGGVLAIRMDGRVQHVDYVIRLLPKGNF
jgi:protocatechuate 3,4-dioxygenase beta subunit